MNNSQGYAEAYKYVIQRIHQGRQTIPEAPDYCFRIVVTRKFFLEARNLVRYQTRHASVLSASTLCVVDKAAAHYSHRFRRIRHIRLPRQTSADGATEARIHYYTFDKISAYGMTSPPSSRKEAVLKDRSTYAETKRSRRAPRSRLPHFSRNRIMAEELARNIALPIRSDPRQLNIAVQRTTTASIFLRPTARTGASRNTRLMRS